MVLGLDSPPCDWLVNYLDRDKGPIFVFVHGLGADRSEWHSVLPMLKETHPSGMFMFRWSPVAARDPLVEALSAGISRLAQCLAGHARPIWVLAHSAGGVIAAYAAGRINVPVGTPLPGVTIFTVGSMLAGTLTRAANADGTEQPLLFLNLGQTITEYPSAAYGVQVFHLRTSYPADYFMKPEPGGRLPNDPSVGVKGARQIDLPPELAHDAALLYVAKKITNGTWREWKSGPK